MTTLIKVIICFVIGLLWLFVPAALSRNLDKEERHRQHMITLAAPILLVILSTIATFCVHVFDDASWEWVRFVFQSYLALIAWNLIVIYVYLLIRGKMLKYVKTMPIPTSYTEIEEPKVMEWIIMQIRRHTEEWYEFDEEDHIWVLKEKYADMRRIVKLIANAMYVLAVLVISYAVTRSGSHGFIQRIYPICMYAVIAELRNFLDGYTKAEYSNEIGGEAISSTLYGNYSKLRSVLEETFGDDLLVSRTNNEFGTRPGSTNYLKELSESEDPVDRIVADYYKCLPGEGEGRFDTDLVQLTNTLLHGKSAVLMNPFYRDIGEYILLPVVNELVNNRRCLVIIGRNSMAKDVKDWLRESLRDYCHTERLWRVEELDEKKPDCEVGILSFSRLYDLDVLKANRQFLLHTDFVLMLEPSHMLTTSQTGLANLAEIIREKSGACYCICDRDTDGLADTLSHVLKVNITDVISASAPKAVYTVMGWDADGDYQRQKLFGKEVHYLGDGTEISAVALKNQVPHVSWYAESKAPIIDLRWIVGQYYAQICRYAGLPARQKTIDDYMTFSSNLWGSRQEENDFLIAEDEFCNLFATARAYMTRGETQSFVNVISENYLLRDYMRMNRQLFMNDHKAIPTIVSAYVKSERNTVFRLILMMAAGQVKESFIIHELSLLDIETKSVYDTMTDLIRKYTVNVQDAIITLTQKVELNEELVAHTVNYYSIEPGIFEKYFRGTLRNAYFIVEDETEGSEYIDARLYEHVTQLVMPGQLIINNGKMYRVYSVNPDGCILHRAGDAYAGRRYYRQMREYMLEDGFTTEKIRRIGDLEIALEKRAFAVETTGYLDMKNNGDLRTARYIDLSDDPQIKAYRRQYRNKNILRLRLPETTKNQRYTLTVLLAELFRSLFPDSWQYIAVLHERPEDAEGVLSKFTYGINGTYDAESIYIVEDSDMDIGLLEAIDNSIIRILEIIADYIDWHFETLQKKEEDPRNNIVHAVVLPADEQLPKEKKNLLKRIRDWFKGIFGGKKNHNEVILHSEAPGNAPEPQEPQDTPEQPETVPAEKPQEEPVPQETEYIPETEGNGIPDPDVNVQDGAPDDIEILIPEENTEYLRRCFLKLGFDEIDSRFDLEGLAVYMNRHGWTNNDLTHSRKREPEEAVHMDLQAELICDFCGKPLSGVSFEKLQDGRIRCSECSRTAINSVEEFRELAERTEVMMENIFGITYKRIIHIETADARTIARQSGSIFRPGPGFASRVLGFARRQGDKYSILIENGSPRLASIETFSHEMTHIWQYLNWDDKEMTKLYGNQKLRLIVYEGMAVWASIQLLYAIGETDFAREQEMIYASRKDEYGEGFRLYREKYGFVTNGDAPMHTPFHTMPPL
ncbi:MAG: hypothetical protein IKS37_05085 [Solobacterium sp.]|nr:hypothetical protein [Solobacterium sp.]